MFSNTQMYMFSNVHLKLKDKKTNRTLKEINKKNTVTKLALNGIASMLKGEFTDSNYNRINTYVPKYLALGTNMPSQRQDTVTVGTSVTVFDNSLLSEINNGSDKLIRVRLEDVKKVDNTPTNEYVKIRYRTVVTSGTIPYSANIQELGLFTNNTDLVGGLWARITTEPITIPENSILDVIWDVVIASSIGIYPSRMALVDSNGDNIDGKELNIAKSDVFPIAVNLTSSIIDGTTVVRSQFKVNIIESTDSVSYVSTNNFSQKVRYVDIYKSENKYQIRYKYDNEQYQDYTDGGSTAVKYDSVELAKPKATELSHQGIDMNGNIIVSDGESVNAYTYKDVTYKNCVWDLYPIGTDHDSQPIKDYVGGNHYNVGDMIIEDGGLYSCIESNDDNVFDSSKWIKIMTFIRYMTNSIVINTYEDNEEIEVETLKFKIVSTVSTGISSYVIINIQ